MTVEQLQTRLNRNSQSPLFARLAKEFLRSHRIDEALRLCEEGLRRFPQYTTAHVVAALCFAERREFQYALQHVEFAIARLPDNKVLEKLRHDWLEKSGVAEEKRDLRSAQELPETSLGELAGKLESNERVTPETDPLPPSAEVPIDEHTFEDAPIVSVTLAEIYAMQGAYEAAVAMYRKLQRQKPQRAEQFESKIRELQEKLRQRT